MATLSGPPRRKKPKATTTPTLYPPGCQEVHEDMTEDELIVGLKQLVFTFKRFGQEEDNVYDKYIPLSLHLTKEFFLKHQSQDVRSLIACCIADILRMYAPDAPYKDQNHVKAIFIFLTEQLEGLKDPNQPIYSQSRYVLEMLSSVKSFNMCCQFEDEDSQDVFCHLFDVLFSILNDNHSATVMSFMLDLLCPLVTESDLISDELLDIILLNLVHPGKSSTKKNSYSLAKELIIKCSDTLATYIQNFFSQVLIRGEVGCHDQAITMKAYDLIYELKEICPKLVSSVIPQLEIKIRSSDETERLATVSLLCKLLSEKGSDLCLRHKSLWKAFLGRFSDASTAVRLECIQHSMHFFLNHPSLRDSIVSALSLRHNDPDESVRLQIMKTVVATAKQEFDIVVESEVLLSFLKEGTLEKKFRVKKEALEGLALIYKKLLEKEKMTKCMETAADWIKDKILHCYYATRLDEQVLVERLFNTYLVPYQLEAKDRMRALLHLYSTVDKNSTKAITEVFKNSVLIRRQVSEMLDVIRDRANMKMNHSKRLNEKISCLSKCLPDVVKASEFINMFCDDLEKKKELMRLMEIIVNCDTDCHKSADAVVLVLKKLGPPIMTNLYNSTIKMLLERISSVLIDKKAISELVTLINDIVQGSNRTLDKELNRGFELLSNLTFLYGNHFDEGNILTKLVKLLRMNRLSPAHVSNILKALVHIGKLRPIGKHYPKLMNEDLLPECKKLVVSGIPKQGKMSIRCLYVNLPDESSKKVVFSELVASVRANLNPDNSGYSTAIVAVGHIAFLFPEDFKQDMKYAISQNIVKDLLVYPHRNYNDFEKTEGDWCEEEDLPELTKCMVQGMKSVARWLMGLKTDLKSAAKTFKMLTAFVDTSGGFINGEVPFSESEKSWLRLSAGTCMLKICEQKGIGDQFTAVQFFTLAKLMNDKVLEVRSRFLAKLHKGLNRGIPSKCLPLDFLGFYALLGYETDKNLKDKGRRFMISDVKKRTDYVIQLLQIISESSPVSERKTAAQLQVPHILPDFMLVFAVAVLSHSSRFISHTDTLELVAARECLWFILEPLILNNDLFSFGFYTTLIERMKIHTNALNPEDEQVNSKMYALCDLAMTLLLQKGKRFQFQAKEHPSAIRIPGMYFRPSEIPSWVNTQLYIPPELQISAPMKSTTNKKPLKSSTEHPIQTKKVGQGNVIVIARRKKIAAKIVKN